MDESEVQFLQRAMASADELRTSNNEAATLMILLAGQMHGSGNISKENLFELADELFRYFNIQPQNAQLAAATLSQI